MLVGIDWLRGSVAKGILLTQAKGTAAAKSSASVRFKPSRADLKSASVRASKIYAGLYRAYPDAGCGLKHCNPFELLVATILSAQCTDRRVNIVTRDLFKQYRSAADFAEAPVIELSAAIMSTGLHRNKARNIKGASGQIAEHFGGVVPGNIDDLLSLPGVGRKTANVVLGNAYGVPAVVCDTHVIRLSRLMGLSGQVDPVKLERDLMGLFARRQWTLLGHLMICHGREVCVARRPDCAKCSVRRHCSYGGRQGR